MILAPNEMKAETDERKAAKVCLEKIQLDVELYKIGHTKARSRTDFEYQTAVPFLFSSSSSSTSSSSSRIRLFLLRASILLSSIIFYDEKNKTR